jgi:hypothetical protein
MKGTRDIDLGFAQLTALLLGFDFLLAALTNRIILSRWISLQHQHFFYAHIPEIPPISLLCLA